MMVMMVMMMMTIMTIMTILTMMRIMTNSHNDDDGDNQCVDDHCDCDDNDVVENRRWVQATQSQTSHPITDPAVEARAKRYVIIILFLTAQEGCHYHRHHPPLL